VAAATGAVMGLGEAVLAGAGVAGFARIGWGVFAVVAVVGTGEGAGGVVVGAPVG